MKQITAGMLSVSGGVLTDTEKKILEKSNPLGITLFKRNIVNKEQVKSLIQSIKEAIGREDVLIAVDQEGGRVCRFISPEWSSYVSQFSLGSLDDEEAKKMTRMHGLLIAYDLKELGVNWNYGPVLDVAYPETTVALASRIFSSDEKKVAVLGQILIDVYQENGICPCIKHLPGHGRAKVDPHLDLPVLSQSLKELEKDFYPFIAVGKNAPAGMTAHIVISAIDNRPVTQSENAIDEIIRKHIGFNGFLISDAIDMKALHGSLSEKTKNCLNAGCDAVCYCFGIEKELQEMVKILPPLTDMACERLARIRQIIQKKCTSFDYQKIYNQYNELARKVKEKSSDYDSVEILHKMEKNK